MRLKDLKVGMRVGILSNDGEIYTKGIVQSIDQYDGVKIMISVDGGGNWSYPVYQLCKIKLKKREEFWLNLYVGGYGETWCNTEEECTENRDKDLQWLGAVRFVKAKVQK